jgi:hypothetical protein
VAYANARTTVFARKLIVDRAWPVTGRAGSPNSWA